MNHSHKHRFAAAASCLVVCCGVALLSLGCSPVRAGAADGATEPVERVLDDFHDAASKADFDRYFGHFAADGVFLGTDATERWTVESFKAYARPHFDAGRGWTYVKRERHVFLDAGGTVAWFDEMLDNASLGTCRGTGVLIREDGGWRIRQYNLSLPVPNELVEPFLELMRQSRGDAAPERSTEGSSVPEG